MTEPVTLDQILTLTQRLSPADKVRLMQRLLADIWAHMQTQPERDTPAPTRSLRGLWADLGTAPSAEEIFKVRREMWLGIQQDVP